MHDGWLARLGGDATGSGRQVVYVPQMRSLSHGHVRVGAVVAAVVAVLLAACSSPVSQSTPDPAAPATSGQALGGERNQTDFQVTIKTGSLGIYSEFEFSTGATDCAAIGNPPGCGLYASDDEPALLCCDREGGWDVTLSGSHETQARQIVQTMTDAFGSENMYWEKSGNKTLQRIACGNLYPVAPDDPYDKWTGIGVLTCIGSMSGDGENPWMIGGPVGDSSYGWQPDGGFLWQDYFVDVSFDGRSTIYFNKSGGRGGTTKSHPNQFVFSVNEGSGADRIETIAYEQTGYSITEKQPWGGVASSWGPGRLFTVTVTAGRHASGGPAGYFNSETDEGARMPTADNVDAEPAELNFATCGTLTVTFADGSTSSDPLCLGQGHVENPAAYVQVGEAGNNWWVGGRGWSKSGCLRSGSGRLAITTLRDVKESATRNNSVYIMPNDNAGLWEDPAVEGPQPLC